MQRSALRPHFFVSYPHRFRPAVYSLFLRTNLRLRRLSEMAAPVETTQQPAQTALDAPRADQKRPPPKEKKTKDQPASLYPLEVRVLSSFISGFFIDGDCGKLNPRPAFFDHRIAMFEQLKGEYDKWVAGESV